MFNRVIVVGVIIALISCLYACSKNDKSKLEAVSSTTQSENETKMVFATRAEIGTSGTCGSKAAWNYDADTKTLAILGSGEMSAPYPSWSLYSSQIENITIGEGITSICDDAFTDCVNLKSIDIPEKVRNIGNNAFCGCKNLTQISIPYDIRTIGFDAFFDTAYYNDVDNWYNDILYIDTCIIKAKDDFQGNYTVFDNISTIASKAFYKCENLSGITITESVKSIGDYAFAGCTNLKSVSIVNWVWLGKDSFADCPNIENLDLYDTYFLDYFENTKYYKNGYKELNGITYIGDYIVEVDENLSGVCNIKEGVKTIDSSLFYDTTITDIRLPSSVRKINQMEDTDFDWYTLGHSLEKITVDEKNPCFSSDEGVLYNKDKTILISYPEGKKTEEFFVPDTVKEMGHAFINNQHIKKIYIGAHVEEIVTGFAGTSYVGAFAGCQSLEAIEISAQNPNYCSDLNGVVYNKRKTVLIMYPGGNKSEVFVIPDTVKTIDECALLNAVYLKKLYIGKNVEAIKGTHDCFPFNYETDDTDYIYDIYYAGSSKEWETLVGYVAENVHFNVKKFPEVTIPTTTKKASSTTPTTKKTNLFDWF